MGFIADAVEDAVDFVGDVGEAVIADAIPLAAGYLTGGASLTVLPPKKSMSGILNLAGVKPPAKPPLARAPAQKVAPSVVAPVSIPLATISPDVQPSIELKSAVAPKQVAQNAPQNNAPSFLSGDNGLLIMGGVGVAILLAVVMSSKK